MKFNHLNVPTHWRNYWTRYPEGHTILEALISWVSQVDSMVDNQNKLNDNVEKFRIEIDEFVGRFDERLQDEVTKTLNDWQTSGFLDVVISEALQWQLDDYIATNEQDKLSINQQLDQTERKTNEIYTEEVVFNRYWKNNEDFATLLQSLLDNTSIQIVRVLEGDYSLSKKVIIPKGKELILTGNNNSQYLQSHDASPQYFTKIKPTFDGDYCFEMYDKSSLRNGFIDCEDMTGGGGILIDFSRKRISMTNVLGTLISGGNNWGVTGILLNGDTPTGVTASGHMFFITLDVGISRAGIGVHLKRTDETNGLAWVNGIKIYGTMSNCQRYVRFNTQSELHAGGSSLLAFTMQGGKVPDPNIPAIEIKNDDTILNCQFHDIGSRSSDQKVKYKLSKGTTNAIIVKSKRDSGIIDEGINTTYLQDIHEYPVLFSEIDDGTTVQDGWYVKNGNTVTINFQVNLPQAMEWTRILTLPYRCNQQTRLSVLSTRGKQLSFRFASDYLYYINTDVDPQPVNVQATYPAWAY